MRAWEAGTHKEETRGMTSSRTNGDGGVSTESDSVLARVDALTPEASEAPCRPTRPPFQPSTPIINQEK